MKSPFLVPLVVLGLMTTAVQVSAAQTDTTPAAQAERFAAQAGRPGDATRGQRLFTQKAGGEWSCASCHGAPPTATGEHPDTGKRIAPLAPAFNPRSFTREAKVDKQFSRNCRDVFARECSAAEKADLTAYLLSLK